jgi:cytochrome c oxidase subunit 3
MAEEPYKVRPHNQGDALPVGGKGTRASGWWGVWTLIVTESSLFGYLLLSYYYLWGQTEHHWPPEGLPKLSVSGINTVILLSSSVFVYLGERSLRKGGKLSSMLWTFVAIILGAVFVGIQMKEWQDKSYGPTGNLYGSLYFTITGFHMMHVVVGLIILSFLTLWTKLGYIDRRRPAAFSIGGVYWHFVDAVWLFVFTSFFLVPYL